MSLIRAKPEFYSVRKTSNDVEDQDQSSPAFVDGNETDDEDSEDVGDGLFTAKKKPPNALNRIRNTLRAHSKSIRDLFAETSDDKDSPSFDARQLRKQFGVFSQLVLPYFKESREARCMLLTLLAFTCVNTGMSIALSYVSRFFWNALAQKDVQSFTAVFAFYVPLMMLHSPIDGYYNFVADQLKVHWRDWMTKTTLKLYLSDCVYYKLSDEIDNPDQRISEDIASFTDATLHFAILLLSNTIGFFSFSLVLWNIYPPLFLAVFLYAFAGTVVTAVLGKLLIILNYKQLRAEANFRYYMVRLRDNAESVAFFGGEAMEGDKAESKIDDVVDNKRKMNVATRNLGFFTIFYHHLSAVLPIVIIAPKFFSGEVEIGVISQSVGAFSSILGNLSIIINNFKHISLFSAGIERLIGFYEAMREVDTARGVMCPMLSSGTVEVGERPRRTLLATQEPGEYSLRNIDNRHSLGNSSSIGRNGTIDLQKWSSAEGGNVTMFIKEMNLFTPDYRRTLISNLSLTLAVRDRLLISGNSGCGKSSLLRAIAGLWTAGNGTIQRSESVYFLPQRPYCVTGSLRDQLLYPKPQRTFTDRELLQILTEVDLLDLVEHLGCGDMYKGLSVELDWGNVLSLGEQQRLSFGRLLVHRPQLAILDESTSALDEKTESRVYEMLQSVSSYVSVGHRKTLEKYHSQRLHLSGGGQFTFETIPFAGGHRGIQAESSSLQRGSIRSLETIPVA